MSLRKIFTNRVDLLLTHPKNSFYILFPTLDFLELTLVL